MSSLRVLLAVILVMASVVKVRSREALGESLSRLGVPRPLVEPVGSCVIAIELAVSGLLIFAGSTVAGVATALLFAVFTIVVLYDARTHPQANCGCLGEALRESSTVSRRATLRVLGVVAGLLIAIVAVQAAPAARSNAAISIGSGLTFLTLLAIRRQSLNAPSTGVPVIDSGELKGLSTPVGRRAVLIRAATATGALAGAGVVVPLSRVFACTGGLGCTFGAQAAAGTATQTDTERSPCFRGCSESKASCDSKSFNQFDTAGTSAGSNDAQLLAAADNFRTQLVSCRSAFQQQASTC